MIKLKGKIVMKCKETILRKIFNKESQRIERAFYLSQQSFNSNEHANYAKLMLDNPIFNEAIRNMESEIFSMWKGSKFNDTEGRQELYVAYQAIQKLKLKLESYANKVRTDELIKEAEKQYSEMVV